MGRVPPGAVCETCRPVARVTVYAGEIVMSARDVQSMSRELLAKVVDLPIRSGSVTNTSTPGVRRTLDLELAKLDGS